MTDSPDDFGKRVIRPKFEVTKGSGNQIEKSASGDFIGIWRGRTVYENGRVKRFQTEDFVAKVLLHSGVWRRIW